MNLRRAQKEDLEQVLALYEQAKTRPGCSWNEYYPTRETAEYDLGEQGLYVLEEGCRIIGAVSQVTPRELDGACIWRVSDGSQREIARVTISRDYAGQGLAKEMLSRLFGEFQASGCRGVHLTAACGNAAALKTYEKLGFRRIETCHMYGGEYWLCEKEL